MLSHCMTNTISVQLAHSSMARMLFGTVPMKTLSVSGLPRLFLFVAKTRHALSIETCQVPFYCLLSIHNKPHFRICKATRIRTQLLNKVHTGPTCPAPGPMSLQHVCLFICSCGYSRAILLPPVFGITPLLRVSADKRYLLPVMVL
jgi:hypothetical protein